ncbi:hypothetical protein [Agromyces bauzanensis]
MHPAFTVTALGARVRVVIEQGALSAAEYDELLGLWEWCGSRAGDDPSAVDATIRRTIRKAGVAPQLSRGDAPWRASASFSALADRLSADVTGAAIEAVRGGLLMLHAAALADPATGRVLAFVGPSGMGKTTVSQRLGRRLAYLSDETTGITDDLAVEPYPKPLSLRLLADGRPKRQVTPASLGLMPAAERSHRLHRVVVLDRRDDAPRHPRIEPLSVTQALAAVTSEVSHLRSLDRPLQRLAAVCAAGGGAVRVSYRDADDLAGVLDEILSRDVTAPSWRAVDTSVVTDAPQIGGRAVRRLPSDDAVADGAGLAVFREGIVHVIAGIGPSLWVAARRASTIDELAATVVSEFGAPEGAPAEAVVGAAVEELVAGGLLEWVKS